MVSWSQLCNNIFCRFNLVKEKVEQVPLSILLAGGAVVLGSVVLIHHTRRRLPPGPVGIPLLGAVKEFQDVKMHEHCMTLAERYGSDVISFRTGVQLWVVINGYDALKEAFITRHLDFANRPETHMKTILGFNDMIFSRSYSDQWRDDKKFSMKAFRGFGVGDKSLEDKIQTQLSQLMDILKQSSDIDPRLPIQRALTVVITSIVYNSNYGLDDPEVQHVIDLTTNFLEKAVTNNEVRHAASWPKWISEILFRNSIKTARDSSRAIQTFMKDKIAEHRTTLDPNNLRDMVDVFLNETEITRDWTEDNLAATLILFLPDAIDSLSSIILWAILYIVKHPEVQNRIHEELDRVVGETIRPSLAHRNDMKYLQSTILEVFRITSSVPLGAIHSASRSNPKLQGYDIPENAYILPNLYSVHMDPKIFPKPDIFDPCRFLQNGEIVNSKYCIPFSLGRRKCLGESLSNMETFLLLANIFHQFRFTFPEDQPDPSAEPEKYGVVLMVPKSYRICPHQR